MTGAAEQFAEGDKAGLLTEEDMEESSKWSAEYEKATPPPLSTKEKLLGYVLLFIALLSVSSMVRVAFAMTASWLTAASTGNGRSEP